MAFASKSRKYLEQAGISERVGMVLGLTGLLALLGGRVVWSLTTSWAWAAIAVVGCASLPVLYVRRQRRLRLGRYAEQLADALDLLTRSLRVGQSFLQGLQTVAGEMPDPTATEFRMTFEALRLGRSLREALQAHADRVDNLDFNLLATALLIQREVGGNLTEILEHASETIRERYKLLGQIRALSAQNRLAGQIIGVLPLAIGVMIYLLQPDLMLVLFKEETGRLLLAAAVVMQVLGFYAMKRLTTIKI
jgi:tight adherence protein B